MFLGNPFKGEKIATLPDGDPFSKLRRSQAQRICEKKKMDPRNRNQIKGVFRN